MSNKWTSRKFWISVAAFLGSLATGVAGIAMENEIVATVGTICGFLSAAIYAGCEAYVDRANAESNGVTKTTTTYADGTVIVEERGTEE